MSLYVSINTPSSELAKSAIDEAITRLAAHAAREKSLGHIPQGPSLDVTFMLPGKHDVPPFNGMRMGGYTRGSDTLYFEVAVPEQVTRATHAPDYVALVMQDVVEHAGEYFHENGIMFDVEHWRRVANTLAGADAALVHAH